MSARCRRHARWLAAVWVACSLLLASGVPRAVAEVRSTDRVDGRTYGELRIPRDALPDVSLSSGILVTADGRALWERRSRSQRSIASITKIMTAIVALERSSPDELVTVGRSSTRVGESVAYLRPGERLPMRELLEALLVKSGNDAAVVIAEHVAGSEESFVRLMNEKAYDLGLRNTHFTNVHGLDAPGHRSTAEDVSVMARYAMSKPLFRRIVGQRSARIGSGARAERVENTNMLLGEYRGANGVKTGWTDGAGYCVVASAARDGIELFAVVLGTRSELARFRDAKELLDFGFAHYRWQRLATRGTVVAEAPVTDYLDVRVPLAFSEETSVPVLDIAGPVVRTVHVAAVRAPVERGDRMGVARFTQRGRVIATVPLVATRDVDRPTVFQRIGISIARVFRCVFRRVGS